MRPAYLLNEMIKDKVIGTRGPRRDSLALSTCLRGGRQHAGLVGPK